MKRPIIWIMIVLVLGGGFAAWYFLFGRGYNLAELRAEYGPRYEAKRQQLKLITDLLPPRGSVEGNTPAQGLDPKPTYHVKQQSFNVEIAMFDHLLNPDADLREKKDVDLLLFEGRLIQNFRIIGPRSPRSPDMRTTGGELAKFEAALNLPYLVVVRPVTFVRPKALTKQSYLPGMADLEIFLVDLRSNKVLGSARFKAESAKSTSAAFSRFSSEQESVEAAAYSTLWEEARSNLVYALREISGGTFELARH
jgi:hypothetical protein